MVVEAIASRVGQRQEERASIRHDLLHGAAALYIRLSELRVDGSFESSNP